MMKYSNSSGDVILKVENLSFSYPHGKSSGGARISEMYLTGHSSEIQAIVGPSGSGKTTLAKTIVSMLPVDTGKITLFGLDCTNNSSNRNIVGIPGPSLGYMPQEEAVPSDLLVRECLFLYGILYQMSLSEISRRSDEVLQRVGLSDKRNKLIYTLSGGMKRRLSLAIAILHSPKLLILDEPTVGIDPILRHQIWNLLFELKSQGICIMITTHYMTECEHADKVNFVREGKIIFSGSPQEIKTLHKVESLGQAFDKMCSYKSILPHKDQPVSPDRYAKPPQNPEKGLSSSLLIVTAIMYRFFRLFFSSPISLFGVFGIATFHVFLLHIAWTSQFKGLKVGLCIEDQTIYNDSSLLTSLNIKPLCLECIHPRHLEDYINREMFQMIPYHDIDKSLEDVASKKIHASLHIRESFSEAFFQRLVIDWSTINPELFKRSQIILYTDATNKLMMRTIELQLNHAYSKYWEGSKANLSLKSLSTYPMRFENSLIDGSKPEDPSDRWTMVGQVVPSTFTVGIQIAGLAMIAVIRDQSIKRFMSTGLTSMDIFLAQLASNSLFISISGLCALILTLYFLEIELRNNFLLAYFMLIIFIVFAVLLGQLIGLLSMSGVMVLTCSMVFSYTISSLEGATIATGAQPYYITLLSELLPHTSGILTLRGVILTNLPLSNPLVYKGFILPSIYVGIFFALAYKMVNKRLEIYRSKVNIRA
ncbi:ABC transporter G family member 23-like [Brevipalpus obovatus]|uniref:ABC transporter G family member 23-like n=1 Tax=Brevipalpus obovatus TaxID=246614 RepID=UPI003D9EC564